MKLLIEDRVVHYSRDHAIKAVNYGLFENPGYDLISISDTWSEQDEVYKLWLSRKTEENAGLFLKFHDISGVESGFDYLKANKIIDFSKESIRKGKNVVVHCYVGVSRSAAIAKFINDYFRLDIDHYENYDMHNRWIYYTLLEEAGIPTLRSYYAEQEKNNESS